MVVLNIIQHLLEATTPSMTSTAASKSVQVDQNSITNPSASPIRQLRPASIVQELKEAAIKETSRKTSVSGGGGENENNSSKAKGHFSDSHHYMRLYENLRNIHSVQRNNLDPNDKIKNLVVDVLNCLSSVFEFAPLDKNTGKHTDEVLSYLKSTFITDPVCTLKTVQALLRCIFGTNSANQVVISNEATSASMTSGIVFSQSTGLFYPCFDQPYNELVHTFHLARDSTSTPDRSESLLFRPSSGSSIR